MRRRAWGAQFYQELTQIIAAAKSAVRVPTPVPAFLVQVLHENDQAASQGRNLDFERLNPNWAPPVVNGLFAREDYAATAASGGPLPAAQSRMGSSLPVPTGNPIPTPRIPDSDHLVVPPPKGKSRKAKGKAPAKQVHFVPDISESEGEPAGEAVRPTRATSARAKRGAGPAKAPTAKPPAAPSKPGRKKAAAKLAAPEAPPSKKQKAARGKSTAAATTDPVPIMLDDIWEYVVSMILP